GDRGAEADRLDRLAERSHRRRAPVWVTGCFEGHGSPSIVVPGDRTAASGGRCCRSRGGSERCAAGSVHPPRRTEMSELAQRMQQDLTDAMKARDEVRVATLRMAIAAVREEAVSGTQARELSDDDVEKVLRTQVKRRDEAAEAFQAAGRD